jgi:hypothetical protein
MPFKSLDLTVKLDKASQLYQCAIEAIEPARINRHSKHHLQSDPAKRNISAAFPPTPPPSPRRSRFPVKPSRLPTQPNTNDQPVRPLITTEASRVPNTNVRKFNDEVCVFVNMLREHVQSVERFRRRVLARLDFGPAVTTGHSRRNNGVVMRDCRENSMNGGERKI